MVILNDSTAKRIQHALGGLNTDTLDFLEMTATEAEELFKALDKPAGSCGTCANADDDFEAEPCLSCKPTLEIQIMDKYTKAAIADKSDAGRFGA